MKQCPKCARAYLDATLNFCLEDGEPLQDYIPLSDFPTEVAPSFGVPPPGGRFSPEGPADDNTQLFDLRSMPTQGQPKSGTPNSIAVLPFSHLSSEPDDEYFCDGLAEELINELAKIEDLKVAARTSAFSFKAKNADIGTIGRQLGVATVLEGSVRKSGNRLRITAQLIGTADGYHIWSERYDREMSDIFEVQDEIAAAVTKALRSKLLGIDEDKSDQIAELIRDLKSYSNDVEAYNLHLRGRFCLNKFTAADAFKAVEFFEQAIALDPRLATAYAGLADANIMLTEMGPVPSQEAMPKAKAAALKALEIDDKLAEAHSALGMVLQAFEYDFPAAEGQFKRAIELSPNNPVPRQAYGALLTELERHDEADVQFRKMLEVDPLSVASNWIHSFCLFLARRYDESLERAKLTLDLDANFGVAYLSVAFAYQMKGEFAQSVEAYARCSEVMGSPENAAYIRKSFKEGWDGFLRAMTSGPRPAAFSSYIVAVFQAMLHNADEAFLALESSFEKRESHIVMMKSDPRFDSLRDDPRFDELLRRIGFSVKNSAQ
ncbi:MAG: hypothetical protein AB7F88_04490 [Pyrinomonadaceae bacterium]